nr:TMV resistance protein N-like [Tanacetum cinerariifolium]
MRKLKFLRISSIHFPHGLSYLSNDLRILDWYECSLKSLPSNFKPTHIYELKMCYSQLETLWEDTLVLPNLRSIDLSYSKDLISIPDLTSTPKLVKLNLEGCTKLRELHESVLLHTSLNYVNLTGCTYLQSLGRSEMEMEALVTLLLTGCSNLENIPEFGQHMKCLENLYVDGTNINSLPKSLGELRNLRKLDASETSIAEIPTSIHYLKRLRRLSVHRCLFSSQSRGLFDTNILSGLRELDLSYCNLSVAPDGFGLLHRLISLDLSGNDFVHLPASISLLSNLKMLCLNNCKRLQSVPKLSIVNEDTLSGLPIRFSYIMSGEEVDMSTFHATSNNTSPIVSCLNCPRLAENENGSYLAERVLNSYLQLRTKYWMTPDAVFEIVAAGSEIPSKFTTSKSDEILLLDGPWVGVAVCAVIAFRHTDANMETKYVVTAHFHDGKTLCKIPVPVNLVPGFENQLVFYWTAANDLQRIVNENQKNTFHVSLSIEPRDGNLQVTNFGVHFIRDEEILQLKNFEDATNKVVMSQFQATISRATYLARGTMADSILFEHTIHPERIMRFILNYDKKYDSLQKIHQIINCLLKLNQEVFKQWKKEWSNAQLLFHLVYDYYRISRGASELYTDFTRLLKDISCTWRSVKLALNQILVKSTADNYSNKEMLQQLNDLEAAESVTLSDKFVTSLAYICKQTVSFSRCIKDETRHNRSSRSIMLMAELSRVMIEGILCFVARYNGACSSRWKYSRWVRMIKSFWNRDGFFYSWSALVLENHYGRELQIQDFHTSAKLLLKLKMKMKKGNASRCVTEENKEEIKKVINKLENNINDLTQTIKDMSNQAFENYAVILDAGNILNQHMEDNKLQVTESRRFIHDFDIPLPDGYEDPKET